MKKVSKFYGEKEYVYFNQVAIKSKRVRQLATVAIE